MTAISTRIQQSLTRGVPVTPLVAFRIIFGALAVFSALRFCYYGWVDSLYIQPKFHFHYLWFEWVQPLPGNWMYLPFVLMTVGGLGILLGAFYRISAVVYFLSFTYVELLDKANYLNHYYFVSIVAFLLIWLPAHADVSVDARMFSNIRRSKVPYWSIWILRFQLTLVYVFAGLAKINSDWLLEAMPLRIWLQGFRDLPLVGDAFASVWLAYVFSWFGCLYDLFIPVFLMLPRTRKWAYLLVIAFHVLTWLLFPIGIFPWVMIGITLIFFPAEWHEKWLRFFRIRRQTTSKNYRKPSMLRLKTVVISIFVVVQLLLPLRYLCYPGSLFWYEEGYRFSWRVMLMEKKGYATFYVVDPKRKGSIIVNNSDYLTDTQIDQMSRQPDMILEFAHFIGNKYRDTVLHFGSETVHLQRPGVEAEVFVTLNGSPHSAFVTRTHNLMTISKYQTYASWVEAPLP